MTGTESEVTRHNPAIRSWLSAQTCDSRFWIPSKSSLGNLLPAPWLLGWQNEGFPSEMQQGDHHHGSVFFGAIRWSIGWFWWMIDNWMILDGWWTRSCRYVALSLDFWFFWEWHDSEVMGDDKDGDDDGHDDDDDDGWRLTVESKSALCSWGRRVQVGRTFYTTHIPHTNV